MPIADITLTPTQFDFLQENLSQQADQQLVISALAQSGLQFVVELQVIAPEVDLVNPFASHLLGIENLDSTSNFTQVVSSMNNHVIARGTTLLPGDTLSDRLNRWLSDNGVIVTQTYARLSSGAGFIVDSANIEP